MYFRVGTLDMDGYRDIDVDVLWETHYILFASNNR